MYGKHAAKARGGKLRYGMISVAFYCESKGYPTDLIEASANNMGDEDEQKFVREKKYSVVC